MRATPANAQIPSAYEYFSGTANAPTWSKDANQSKPIFTDPAGTWHPSIDWNPGLGRYLLNVAHSKVAVPSSNKLGVFELTSLFGPWRTVYYVDNFLGMRGGYLLGMHVPIKWQSADGRALQVVFSCHDNIAPGSCGEYHDRFNLMKATLTVGGAGS